MDTNSPAGSPTGNMAEHTHQTHQQMQYLGRFTTKEIDDNFDTDQSPGSYTIQILLDKEAYHFGDPNPQPETGGTLNLVFFPNAKAPSEIDIAAILHFGDDMGELDGLYLKSDDSKESISLHSISQRGSMSHALLFDLWTKGELDTGQLIAREVIRALAGFEWGIQIDEVKEEFGSKFRAHVTLARTGKVFYRFEFEFENTQL